MTDKKYSEEDVKRIVKEALKESEAQKRDDDRIIKEAVNESTDQETDSSVPTHWKRNDNANKPIKYKEQNMTEMRHGCGFLILIFPIIIILFAILMFASL